MSRIKYLFIVFSLLLQYAAVYGQNVIRFNHTYGMFTYNYGMSVHQEADTGYVILSNVSGLYGQNNIQLFKIDKNGNYVWDALYSDSAIYRAEKMAPLPGGGYIITGYTNANSDAGYDVFLLKTGPQGQKEWLRTYGGSDWDFGADVKPVPGGGYIVGATTYSFGNGHTDYYLFRTDAQGDTLWTRTFGGTEEDILTCLTLLDDGCILAGGYSKSNAPAHYDALLYKTDASGTYLWHKYYGGTGDEKIYDVYSLFNDSIVMGGHTSSYGNGGDDYYLIYADSAGNQLWHKADGGPDNERAYTMALTADSGYVLSGHSAGPGYDDVYFYKMRPNGDWHCSTSHGSVYPDYASCIRQTLDGGYIIVGSTAGFASALSSVYVVKTGPDGLSEPYNSIGEVAADNVLFNMYPNPSCTDITIETEQDARLDFVNMQGQIVFSAPVLQGLTRIGINHLPAGIYIVKMQGEKGWFVKRFMKE